MLVNQRENLTLDKESLRVLLHAPLYYNNNNNNNNNNNDKGLLNTCSGTRCELIHVYKFKVGNRKYKNAVYLKLI